MFADCQSEIEKNKYKTDKLLQKEVDDWMKVNDAAFYKVQRIGDFSDVFEQICKKVEIPETDGEFVHFIDYKYLFDTTRGYRFENISPDYDCIIKNGLCALKYHEEEVTNKFCKDYNRTIDSLLVLSKRIAEHEKKRGDSEGNFRAEVFARLAEYPAETMFEGCQRILFFHQMFWQMGQRLMGLGHLDFLLEDLYQIEKGKTDFSREKVKGLLKSFLVTLHHYCWLKSNMLLGDTGQIIILGGKDETDNYRYNDLTYLFMEAIEEIGLPDPKVLLRVDKNTPHNLIRAALKCMKSGVGSPILSNDDQVIPRLVAFGVSREDARNYGVAACWEPLIPGKSISPNNMKSITYPKIMQRVWERKDVADFVTLDRWMAAFYEEVKNELDEIVSIISEARFQYNPYLSLFMKNCKEKKQDVSWGGADYNSYGLTTVGLSNTVNAIFNLKELVYEKNEYTIQEVKDILQNNFKGHEDLVKRLYENENRYGMDKETVISLANEILTKTSDMLKPFRNYMGGKLKMGASSPSYIDAANGVMASFDGRKKGEAFGVHISSETNNGYTEILNFASKLDYNENRFNGNVVDFMVSPGFIDINFDKMVVLILAGIKIGFFQLQMNVISADILIDAKNNPQRHQNLVVRVWGFSAYFSDLPEEYQNVLINRALQNENK